MGKSSEAADNGRTHSDKFSRRDMLKLGAGALGGAALAPQVSRGEAIPGPRSTPRRPNIIHIMGDGIQPGEMSGAGNPIIRTPNMDRIANEGMRFQNAFVTNALCAPSRGVILTGQYSCRNGVIDNKSRPIASDVPIFPELLHKEGYEVAFCGKSHIKGALRNYYWDYYLGYRMQKAFVNAPMAEGVDGKIGGDQVIDGYSDDIITQGFAGWLEGRRQKPFYASLWLKAPHAPFIPPRHLALLYNDGTKIPVPDTFNEDLKGYPGKPRAFASCDNKIGVDSINVRTLEGLVKKHYAATVGFDENIGRILKVLEESGELDNTVIMVTADHGYILGEWHFMDKRLMHEPSIRIPLLVRYPDRIKAGTLSDKMVLNLDTAPTILELAGVDVPSAMQGRSLVPLLEGKDPIPPWRKDWFYAFYEYPGPAMVPKNRGIRTERYKLIEYWEQIPKQYELYDLQSDLGERHNLYGDPKHANLTNHLLDRMYELGKECGEI
jgi:arylsulfatase A-like enzyme